MRCAVAFVAGALTLAMAPPVAAQEFKPPANLFGQKKPAPKAPSIDWSWRPSADAQGAGPADGRLRHDPRAGRSESRSEDAERRGPGARCRLYAARDRTGDVQAVTAMARQWGLGALLALLAGAAFAQGPRDRARRHLARDVAVPGSSGAPGLRRRTGRLRHRRACGRRARCDHSSRRTRSSKAGASPWAK